MKIAIFLGAGASAAEHCPIQSQLFVEYFKSLTQKDYKSEMNIELHKFFKDMFNIDIINDDIDKISFPTFEEVLGLIDLAEQRRESFKNFGLENLHKKSDSIRILRQYLILLMAKSLHNCEKTNNYYHKLLIDNLLKEDLLKDTTFISANYDIHIDNTIAGLYKKDNPIMLDYGVDFTNIMPILKTPPESLLKGTFFTLASFNGIELVMLAIPYTNNKKKIKKNIIYSILFTGIFMTAMTIITICRFGYAETKLQMWPIISMTDTINIPGSFLERQEALIMSFWIISVFAIVNAGLFFSSLLAKSIIKKGKHSYYIIIFIILCFLMLFVPSDINQVYNFINLMFVTFGVAYMIVIPIVLLIIAKLRRLGVKYEEN